LIITVSYHQTKFLATIAFTNNNWSTVSNIQWHQLC